LQFKPTEFVKQIAGKTKKRSKIQLKFAALLLHYFVVIATNGAGEGNRILVAIKVHTELRLLNRLTE
jgi:HD superfamily phosphohydrolase YqeK